ncbi:MAG: hypothetical protein M3O30_08195 [Planctomycetota bacterium]|nr:hypothetical protein [Planctomycetota bacterium]
MRSIIPFAHPRILRSMGLLLGLLACNAFADAPRATADAAGLCRGMVQQNSRAGAWLFEYRSVAHDQHAIPAGGYFHVIVSAAAPDSYFSWGGHGTMNYAWREDPFQQRLFVKAGKAISERPFNRQYLSQKLDAGLPLPGTAPRELIFLSLGWWPLDLDKVAPPKMVRDGPVTIPDIARTPGYVVRPMQEMSEGGWCHVLEFPGHDRIWIDTRKNCAIARREVLDPDSGEVIERIINHDLWEAKPGIWAPKAISISQFNEDDEGKRALRTDFVITILTLRLNEDVDRKLFDFQSTAGNVLIYPDARFEQTEPGGTEYLDDVINRIQRHLPLKPISANSSFPTFETIAEYLISIASLLVLCVVQLRNRQRKVQTKVFIGYEVLNEI